MVTVPHEHRIAAPSEWPWLPTRPGGRTIPHPYCETCGLIKALGADRPMKQGGIANVVSELSDLFTATGRKVTEAQRRLVHRRLADQAVDDPFAHTRAGQIALLVDAFSKYTGIPPDAVVSHLARLGSMSMMPRR